MFSTALRGRMVIQLTQLGLMHFMDFYYITPHHTTPGGSKQLISRLPVPIVLNVVTTFYQTKIDIHLFVFCRITFGSDVVQRSNYNNRGALSGNSKTKLRFNCISQLF